jgi:hypothetical protein
MVCVPPPLVIGRFTIIAFTDQLVHQRIAHEKYLEYVLELETEARCCPPPTQNDFISGPGPLRRPSPNPKPCTPCQGMAFVP